ncbi:hypothetical protein IJT93_08440 [bacterium]|nr:hypothetical protein [bacterium]
MLRFLSCDMLRNYAIPEKFRYYAVSGLLVCSCFGFTAGCSCENKAVSENGPSIINAVDSKLESDRSGASEFRVKSSPYEYGSSLLNEYYMNRLESREANTVRTGIAIFLPDYNDTDSEDVLRAVMSYQYVVYHITDLHDLRNNHAVARQAEPKLRIICNTLNVPLEPVLGIVSWENSGDTSKVSYANAAGLGQMTAGAVDTAHQYGEMQAKSWREEAARLRLSMERSDKVQAERLDKAAKMAECRNRHEEMAKANKVEDERLIMECNLEDTVLFFKYLLSKYDNRVDLAVSAYHNGVVNTDDIIYDYLRQVKNMDIASETDPSRRGLVEAIQVYDIKFIDLWNNKRSREILCGIRTVNGEKANADNIDMTLGDESDLYPWKVIGSYAGYVAGESFVTSMQQNYSGSFDESMVRGLPVYDSAEDMKNGAAASMLCTLDKDSFKNCGVDSYPETSKKAASAPKVKLSEKKEAARQAAEKKAAEKKAAGVPADIKELCWHALPELAGYLAELRVRWGTYCGNDRVRIPLKTVSGAWTFSAAGNSCVSKKQELHRRGLAADIDMSKLPASQRSVLERLIVEDFLLDKIYMDNIKDGGGNIIHIVLNPRCGDNYLENYISYVSPDGRIARAREEFLHEEEAKAAEARARKEAKLNSSPRYRTQAAREAEERRRQEEVRQYKEQQAKEAAQSRASAAKRRVARKQPKRQETVNIAPTEEPEEELYAIPDDNPIYEGPGSASGSKSRSYTRKTDDDEVYSF